MIAVVTSLDSDLYPKYSFKRETIDIIANKFVFSTLRIVCLTTTVSTYYFFYIKLKWLRNRQTYCVKENNLKFCPQKVSSKFPNGLFCFQIHCNQIHLDIAVFWGISNQSRVSCFLKFDTFLTHIYLPYKTNCDSFFLRII